jgi:hypothetical protein
MSKGKIEDMDGEAELKPGYVTKALRMQKQPAIEIGTVKNLRRRYEKST